MDPRLHKAGVDFSSNYHGVPPTFQPQQHNIAYDNSILYLNPAQANYWNDQIPKFELQRPHSVDSYSSSPEPWNLPSLPTNFQPFPQDFKENVTAVRRRRYQRKIPLVNRRVKSEPLTDEETKDQRQQANMRERQRTSSLNSAFQALRVVVPHLPSDKMSKIHTLQITVSYIHFLTAVQQGTYSIDQPEIMGYSDSREKLSCAFQMWRMEEERKRKLLEEPSVSDRLNDCQSDSPSGL